MTPFLPPTLQRVQARLLVAFAALIIGMCFATPSQAVVSQYIMKTGTGNLTDMSGGGTIWQGYQGYRGNNGYTPSLAGYYNFGFNFVFDGTSYSQCVVYTSGMITLGTTIHSNYISGNMNSLNTATLAPWMAFMQVSGTQGSCINPPVVSYKTLGSAPNRSFVVQWRDIQMGHWSGQSYGAAYGYGYLATFEVRIYESASPTTNGKIEYYYENLGTPARCSYYEQGLFGQIGFGTSTSNYGFVSFSGSTPSINYSGTAPKIIGCTGTSKPSSRALYTFENVPNTQLSSSPKFVNFGTVPGGGFADMCVTVRNAGTEGTLTFTSASLAGSNTFSIISSPAGPLTPGQTATYCIRFAPVADGALNSILTIVTNGRDSGTQQIVLFGDGLAPTIEVQPIGENFVNRMFRKTRVLLGDTTEQGIILKNIGRGELVLLPPTGITGDNAQYYWISRYPDVPLTTGVSDTLFVKFNPRLEGLLTAKLNMFTNASNGAKFADLVGVGVIPRIVVTPDPLRFDSVQMGVSDTMKFSICNPGSDTLELLNNYMSSGDADFTFVPLTGSDRIIAPEKCREVMVIFTPKQMGTRVARFAVQTNIPLTFDDPRRDTARSVLYYDISGTGVPIGTLSSTDLSAGGILDSTLIGVEKCRNTVITNFGDADVTITSAMFTGASSSIYSLKGITLPHVLKAKASVTVQVCATPTLAERGSNLVNLAISGMSNDKPSLLTGTVDIIGQLACVTPNPAMAFETVLTPHNVKDSSEVTITNCGDVATAYNVSISGADAGLYSVTPVLSPVVAPGGTTTFWVYFTPISSGPKPATLNFTGTAVSTTVDLAGTGACAILDPVATVTAPSTPANGTQEFTVTVHNSGNLAWNPGTAVITPPDAFKFVSGAPIAPGTDGTITFSFDPPSMNTFTAVISFPDAEVCGNALEINVSGTATTGAVGEVSEAGYVLTQNSPNPAAGGFTSFSYTVPEQSNVRIVLADVTGKIIRELVNTSVATGTYDVGIETQGLASGTYLYILEAGNARLVRQLAIQK